MCTAADVHSSFHLPHNSIASSPWSICVSSCPVWACGIFQSRTSLSATNGFALDFLASDSRPEKPWKHHVISVVRYESADVLQLRLYGNKVKLVVHRCKVFQIFPLCQQGFSEFVGETTQSGEETNKGCVHVFGGIYREQRLVPALCIKSNTLGSYSSNRCFGLSAHQGEQWKHFPKKTVFAVLLVFRCKS